MLRNRSTKLSAAALMAAAVALVAGEAAARDQIRIVGSSTVFPFTTAVAEQFGKITGRPTPVVESTGSGGGIKLFCAGVGADFPDVANSSRRMKVSELETCAQHGVTSIREIMVGYDGVVIANAVSGPAFDLSLQDLYLAVGKSRPDGTPNPSKNWSDVNPSLPSERIEVLGPPPTSGTRDSFAELGLEPGCHAAGGKAACTEIREDGVWIDAGENDNVIVQKLAANPGAVGVFGFSYLEENGDKVKGATISGVTPSAEAIASGSYPLARSLYIYVKGEHIGAVPGLDQFVQEYLSDGAAGEDGYLADKGLIALLPAQLEAQRVAVGAGAALTAADLQH